MPGTQFGCHIAVAGASHAQVHLVERHDVGAGQLRMRRELAGEYFEPVAVLDVPVRDAERRDLPGLGRSQRTS